MALDCDAPKAARQRRVISKERHCTGLQGGTMKYGAFALMDCLGFKGLWKNGHEQLLSKLRLVRTSVLEGLQVFINNSNYPVRFNTDFFMPEVRLLSDRVAISLTHNEEKFDSFSDLLAITATIQAVANLFLQNEPHLFLRGCITHGQHLIDENFLIGPAVDETAEYVDTAQGAFVWFLPNAAKVIDTGLASLKNQNLGLSNQDLILSLFDAMCPQYQIPMNNGHNLDTRVVNPILNKDPEASGLLEVCAKTMDVNKMDVWVKRQHTLMFLTYCMKRNKQLKRPK